MHKTIAKNMIFLSAPVRDHGIGVTAFRFEAVVPAGEKMQDLPANSPRMALPSRRQS